MQDDVLQVSYELTLNDYRRLWLTYYKRGVPSLFAFWGTGAFIWLVLFFFTSLKAFFLFLILFSVAVPVTVAYILYETYMQQASRIFSELSAKKKLVHLTFTSGANGFDFEFGDDFSHISWNSVASVVEERDYFAFERAGSIFYVPKSAFRDESELRFLRFLIAANVGGNAKLLK